MNEQLSLRRYRRDCLLGMLLDQLHRTHAATRKRLPIHQHLTGLRALKPGKHAAQRGFAEPRGRLQRHALAGFHLQAEPAVQRFCAGIPERDVSSL